MLQRIQSVYLFLAALALSAMFILPIAHNVYIGTTPKTFKVDGMYEDVAGHLTRTVSFLSLTIITILLMVIAIVIMFRYSDRKQQLALSYGLILALIGFSFWMTQTVKEMAQGITFKLTDFYYGALMPTVAIIFVLMAIKAIKNDEKLIKSADRLR
jgi:hypothetical protein